MKIVHISHLYHPSSGGVQFFFKNISERLVNDFGDDVTVVTTDSYYGPERNIFKKISPATETINGVKVIRFPYRRWHLRPFWLVYKALGKLGCKKPVWMVERSYGPWSPQMKKYLLQVECDAFCGSSSNYLFMQLPLWRKCKFFYYGSIHLLEKQKKAALFPRQVAAMNAANLYLANTGFEKNRLVAAGVKKEKIFVLGTGVDMKPFLNADPTEVLKYKAELQIPGNALVVGFVGRIELTKSVNLVVQVFEKLASTQADLYLLVAGSANAYAADLQQRCQALPAHINSRIKWQLNFDAAKKPLIFQAIDILVLPSKNKSFGLVFLEAWSCKKPVIGAAIGAVRDVIADGVDGLLMDVDSEPSLTEKLQTLIGNKDLRLQMGENGFAKVNENYTWDIIVARLRKCYLDAQQTNN